MRYQRIEAWVEQNFVPESRPDLGWVRRLCREDKLPATKWGGLWYIDLVKLEAGKRDETDDIVDSILAGKAA